MRVETIEPGQIYKNSRNHIMTRHGKHICYIDIPHEAIVYVQLKQIKSTDWELYLPESQQLVVNGMVHSFVEETLETVVDESLDTVRSQSESMRSQESGHSSPPENHTTVTVVQPKRKPGRPKKNAGVA